MDHVEAQTLIEAYVDGELDAANAHDVEEHLRTCQECRGVELRIRDLRTVLTASVPAYRATSRLRKNVRAALRQEAKSGTEGSWPFLRWPILATAFALLLLGVFVFQSTRSSRSAVVDEVIAAHVRSLLATHLVDVASSDQHTVKPWFNGKVDFAPEVQDFAKDGFPLVGGRLDYLGGKTAVALVYRRNQHPINVLIAPAPGKADSAQTSITRRGYNLLHWTRNEMEYWAVSDLNGNELQQFVSHLNR